MATHLGPFFYRRSRTFPSPAPRNRRMSSKRWIYSGNICRPLSLIPRPGSIGRMAEGLQAGDHEEHVSKRRDDGMGLKKGETATISTRSHPISRH